MRAIIVADGDVPNRGLLEAAWPGWSDGVSLVIAADGGARAAERLGFAIDLLIGDGDSLDRLEIDRLRASGVAVQLAAVAKDESDTELAVRAAIHRGADQLTIVGGLGGRLDHALANIWLLALPDLADRPAILVDSTTRVRLLRAPRSGGGLAEVVLPGRIGDLVTLLPLGPTVEGVTTDGLHYPLRDEPLLLGPARGLSNVRATTEAHVSLRRGQLLIIETWLKGEHG